MTQNAQTPHGFGSKTFRIVAENGEETHVVVYENHGRYFTASRGTNRGTARRAALAYADVHKIEVAEIRAEGEKTTQERIDAKVSAMSAELEEMVEGTPAVDAAA